MENSHGVPEKYIDVTKRRVDELFRHHPAIRKLLTHEFFGGKLQELQADGRTTEEAAQILYFGICGEIRQGMSEEDILAIDKAWIETKGERG